MLDSASLFSQVFVAIGFLVSCIALTLALFFGVLAAISRYRGKPALCDLGFHDFRFAFDPDSETYTELCIRCGQERCGGIRWIRALIPVGLYPGSAASDFPDWVYSVVGFLALWGFYFVLTELLRYLGRCAYVVWLLYKQQTKG